MQPELIFYIVVLVFSIIIHEVAHGYAANALGDSTARRAGRLTLNPLPHLDFFGSILLPFLLVITNSNFLFGWAKPVPYNPYNLKNQRWGEVLVAGAGVATNLLFALIFGLATRYLATNGMEVAASATAIITLVNLFLGLFNLIPIPPLDGFTVLRGILPYRFAASFQAFERQLASGGIFMLLAFLLLFSYLFLEPFARFVSIVFTLITGVSA